MKNKLWIIAADSTFLTRLFSILLVIFYGFQDFTQWPLMSKIGAQGGITYGDAHIVLTYADCYSNMGNSVFESGESCSRWANGSGLLQLLSFLGATNSLTNLFGHVFTYLLIFTFICFLCLLQYFKFAQVTLFLGLISPPVWLLMERANFDSLMYLLTTLSVLFFHKNYLFISVALVFLSSLLKFYTLPLLLLMFFMVKRTYNKAFILGATFLSMILVFMDFEKIQKFPHTAGYNHFGMRIIGNYLGKIGLNVSTTTANIIGASVFLLCLILILVLILITRYNFRANYILGLQRTSFLFLSSVHISCFVAGLSVDYRLIFYLTSAPLIITYCENKLKIPIAGLYLLSTWLTYASGNFQPIGDFALGIMTSLIFIYFLVILGFRSRLSKISSNPKV